MLSRGLAILIQKFIGTEWALSARKCHQVHDTAGDVQGYLAHGMLGDVGADLRPQSWAQDRVLSSGLPVM